MAHVSKQSPLYRHESHLIIPYTEAITHHIKNLFVRVDVQSLLSVGLLDNDDYFSKFIF